MPAEYSEKEKEKEKEDKKNQTPFGYCDFLYM